MAMQNSQSEPSMEEILASIRRIISEDEDTPKRSAEPPLELTKPAPPTADPIDDLMVFEEEDEPPPRVEPQPAPAPVARAPIPPMPAAPAPSFAEVEDTLTSGEAVSAAAGAFTRLAGSLRLSEAPGQTLEGIVRELLRPMMKEWLDTHLAAIVEAKVEAELDRISRMSR